MMLPSLLPTILMVVVAAKGSLVNKGRSGLGGRALKPLQFVLGYFGIWSSVGLTAYFGLVFLFRFYPPSPASVRSQGWQGGPRSSWQGFTSSAR